MLRPIKNFLNYLQKNSNGSTIFATSSNITDSTHNSSNINPIGMVNNMGPSLHDKNEEIVIIDDDEIVTVVDSDEDTNINSAELIDLTESEIIVFDSPDLNQSINTDPGTDPLAIDDFEPIGDSLISNLDTTNTSDIDPEGEVLFIIDLVDPLKTIPEKTGEGDKVDKSISNIEEINEEQEIRSDGSDSGLGSETSALQSTLNSSVVESPQIIKVPGRSNLKRRALGDSCQSEKKPKRSINFDEIKVYYFPRIQGFGCVPSQGGCTLGMSANHISWRSFTLAEHAAEQRRAHKQQMQEINPRGSSSDDSDSDDEITDASASDLDADTNGFLQPVHARQRRALLKAAGVRKIDPSEKDECREIRNSREFCGCSCRGFCDPDTCACSQAGIKCQVDRPNFPCGCSRDGCGNIIGRVEFNQDRVRTHYFHTKMRLNLENSEEKRHDELDSGISSAFSTTYSDPGNITATINSCNSRNSANSYDNLSNYSLGNSANSSPNQSNPYNNILHSNNFLNNQENLYSNVLLESADINQQEPSGESLDHGSTTCTLVPTHTATYSNANNSRDSLSLINDNRHFNGLRDASMLDFQISENLYAFDEPNTPFMENTEMNTTINVHYSNTTYPNYEQHYPSFSVPESEMSSSSNSLLLNENKSNCFISLNSSNETSRLDGINDLLQKNRHNSSSIKANQMLECQTGILKERSAVHRVTIGNNENENIIGFDLTETSKIKSLKEDFSEALQVFESCQSSGSSTPEFSTPNNNLSPRSSDSDITASEAYFNDTPIAERITSVSKGPIAELASDIKTQSAQKITQPDVALESLLTANI